ncbi:MAG: DUF2769 domain-containing protein [Alphaproteobacteria bacterium]|nr:DUF2769 domain-containing protein [Alphaproteobacteria bacterium]
MLVEKTKENLKECQCHNCPSYTLGCKIKNYPIDAIKMFEDIDNLEHLERMFCAFEKSHCIEEDHGCLCETCPIYAKYDLVRDEYCMKTGGNLSHKCMVGLDEEANHPQSSEVYDVGGARH